MLQDQILNIVAFCTLMQNNDGILDKSPDYILEKFDRYCKSDNAEYPWGLDYKNEFLVESYKNKWLKI